MTQADGRPNFADAFDFLHGRWTVQHRRLRGRLVGGSRWDEFGGTMVCRAIMRGLGNFDENDIDLPQGRYRASTLRLFDPRDGTWNIRWIDGRHPDLGPPVHGGFKNGAGVFLGDDVHNGSPVKVRYVWSGISAASARWEQAFSADGGSAWEVNWEMGFSRA